MPISQQTITGSVKTPANADAAITGVRFTLSGSDYEAGEIIAVNTVQAAVTESTGDFEVTLWPNDAGMVGNTTYSMAFTFSDGSTVPGLKSIYVRASEGDKTIEDVAFETIAAGAVKPYAIRLISQEAYNGLSPKPSMTIFLTYGAA